MSKVTEFVVRDCFGCPFGSEVLPEGSKLHCYYPGASVWVVPKASVVPETCPLRESSALVRVSYNQMTATQSVGQEPA